MKMREQDERNAGTVQMTRYRRQLTKWREPILKLISIPVPSSPQASKTTLRNRCTCEFMAMGQGDPNICLQEHAGSKASVPTCTCTTCALLKIQ